MKQVLLLSQKLMGTLLYYLLTAGSTGVFRKQNLSSLSESMCDNNVHSQGERDVFVVL